MTTTTFIFGSYTPDDYDEMPPFGTTVTMTWEDPVTERVPWYEAKGRRAADTGYTIKSVQDDDEGPTYGSPNRTRNLVDADGTIEVLVDG